MNIDKHWPAAYIGLPFEKHGYRREGLDCYGLIYLLFKEIHGIELKLYRSDNLKKQSDLFISEAKLHPWRELQKKEAWQAFDVLTFNIEGIPNHVGVVIDSKDMLHIRLGTNSLIESYGSPLWKNRIVEAHRNLLLP